DAWVGASDVTRITGLADETTLAADTTTGGEGAQDAQSDATEAPEDGATDEAANDEGADDEAAQDDADDPEELATVPAPGGADLWESTESGDGAVSLEFDEDAQRTAFVIGTDGEAPAASEISLTWPNDSSTPWAIPLMLVGGGIVLVGLIVGFFSLRAQQREVARRKARQERRRRLAETSDACAIVPVIALTGCAPEELPQAEPAPAPTEAGPAVTDDQVTA